MPDIYAHVHVPNAKRMAKRATPNEDVRGLVNVIRRTATGPKGQTPTLEDIAALIGVSPATLRGYLLKPRTDRSSVQRGVPYTVKPLRRTRAQNVSRPRLPVFSLWMGQLPSGDIRAPSAAVK